MLQICSRRSNVCGTARGRMLFSTNVSYGTTCPGSPSQSCGGENVYSFHLNFLWVALVEARQCDGLPEPEVSNLSRSTTICFIYQTKLKSCESSCPDGMRLASHDTVCDPISRKCGVTQSSVPTVPSSCPDGMRLTSHDTVCDPISRKCGVTRSSVPTVPTSSTRKCSHCAMKGKNMFGVTFNAVTDTRWPQTN